MDEGAPGMAAITPSHTYRAYVTEVIDGDTFDAMVDPGFHLTIKLRLRLARVNTPELHAKDPEVRSNAAAARMFVAAHIDGAEVLVITRKADAFGRYLAEVWYELLGEQVNLSDQLLATGHAVPYERKQ